MIKAPRWLPEVGNAEVGGSSPPLPNVPETVEEFVKECIGDFEELKAEDKVELLGTAKLLDRRINEVTPETRQIEDGDQTGEETDSIEEEIGYSIDQSYGTVSLEFDDGKSVNVLNREGEVHRQVQALVDEELVKLEEEIAVRSPSQGRTELRQEDLMDQEGDIPARYVHVIEEGFSQVMDEYMEGNDSEQTVEQGYVVQVRGEEFERMLAHHPDENKDVYVENTDELSQEVRKGDKIRVKPKEGEGDGQAVTVEATEFVQNGSEEDEDDYEEWQSPAYISEGSATDYGASILEVDDCSHKEALEDLGPLKLGYELRKGNLALEDDGTVVMDNRRLASHIEQKM